MMSPPRPVPRRFYFALPRLFAHLTGGDATPAETNWLEANIVGAAVMLISYLTLRRAVLSGQASVGRDLLWALPLVLATWGFWLVTLSIGSLMIRMLRAIGLLSGISNARTQGVFVAIITTVFALQLMDKRTALIGWLWLSTLCANEIAALLLALTSRGRDAK